MIYISHRGNIDGKNPQLENKPSYIDHAISLGYDVEIDIWMIDGFLFLGHDAPQYGITQNWRCKYMNGFIVNNDCSLSICQQKNFIKPISIYDIGEGSLIDDKKVEEDFLKNTVQTSQNCSGCFQVFKFDEEFWSGIE
jgi:hypothetical protein